MFLVIAVFDDCIFFFFCTKQHYRNMSVAPTVRRPANTVGDRLALKAYFCSVNNETKVALCWSWGIV
jgi:hypothetical protein